MGPSGSGKSTLLNSLALRLDRAVTIEGSLRLNGREYDVRELKLMSGYVMQGQELVAGAQLHPYSLTNCPPTTSVLSLCPLQMTCLMES